MRSRKKVEVAMQEGNVYWPVGQNEQADKPLTHMCLHEEEELSPSVR